MGLLRRSALSLLAAVLTALITATLLVLAWLVFDSERALGDAPSAWLGLFMVTLMFGAPSAALFGVVVAPLSALAERVRPRWRLLACMTGGAALVWLTTDLRFSALGALGGLIYAALEGQFTRATGRRRTEPGGTV